MGQLRLGTLVRFGFIVKPCVILASAVARVFSQADNPNPIWGQTPGVICKRDGKLAPACAGRILYYRGVVECCNHAIDRDETAVACEVQLASVPGKRGWVRLHSRDISPGLTILPELPPHSDSRFSFGHA